MPKLRHRFYPTQKTKDEFFERSGGEVELNDVIVDDVVDIKDLHPKIQVLIEDDYIKPDFHFLYVAGGFCRIITRMEEDDPKHRMPR